MLRAGLEMGCHFFGGIYPQKCPLRPKISILEYVFFIGTLVWHPPPLWLEAIMAVLATASPDWETDISGHWTRGAVGCSVWPLHTHAPPPATPPHLHTNV